MRVPYVICYVLGMGMLMPACSMVKNTADNLVTAPIHYPFNLDRCMLKLHSRRFAEDAWRDIQHTGPYHDSPDYAKGFKDGFADYLRMGGTGEPPPVPPRKYWASVTPLGRESALKWFEGFRHGSNVAKQQGLRHLIVVPVSVSSVPPPPHFLHSFEGGERSFPESPILRNLPGTSQEESVLRFRLPPTRGGEERNGFGW